MQANFAKALAFTLQDKIEGGFSANDPGGPTMHGITLAEFRLFYNNPALSVDDLKNITDAQLQDIYHKSYWLTVSADELPDGVDLSVFDAGVNTGPGTAVRQLQKAVDVSIDGRIGPVTLGAVNSSYHVAVLVNLWTVQTAYYRALPTFPEFGHDWLNRAAWRLQAALDLAVT
jgi:lysozyme family protein